MPVRRIPAINAATGVGFRMSGTFPWAARSKHRVMPSSGGVDPLIQGGRAVTRDAFPAIASTAAVLLAGVFLLPFVAFGPLSTHMAIHIGVMNALAPLAAVAALRFFDPAWGRSALWGATGLQIVLLWALHAPALHVLPGLVQTMAHLLLAGAALVFWMAILALPRAERWRALLPLVVTGKLACLLGVLLIFAPRLLYGAAHGAPGLEDQQLAGLLMVTACPLTYLVAAVVSFVQLLADPPAPVSSSVGG